MGRRHSKTIYVNNSIIAFDESKKLYAMIIKVIKFKNKEEEREHEKLY